MAARGTTRTATTTASPLGRFRTDRIPLCFQLVGGNPDEVGFDRVITVNAETLLVGIVGERQIQEDGFIAHFAARDRKGSSRIARSLSHSRFFIVFPRPIANQTVILKPYQPRM